MGWQCAIVSIAYLAGTIIQGLIVLNQPDYDFQRWHGTMLVIAISTFSILFNTFLAKNLPFVEGLILIIHVVGLFAIIIPLWVLAPRNNVRAVFTTFNNGGGWDNSGTATLVGLSTTITSMLGYDCAVHMCKAHLLFLFTSCILLTLILDSRRNQRCIRDFAQGYDVLSCR
jgi:amino acid transporter